jgi:hypothetical protein
MAAAMGGSNAPTIMKTIVRRSHAKTSGDHTVRDHEERRHGMLTDLSADIEDYGDILFSFSHEHSSDPSLPRIDGHARRSPSKTEQQHSRLVGCWRPASFVDDPSVEPFQDYILESFEDACLIDR